MSVRHFVLLICAVRGDNAKIKIKSDILSNLFRYDWKLTNYEILTTIYYQWNFSFFKSILRYYYSLINLL